jgi:U3 small nucleolar RNA-associated protein 22
MDFSKLNAVVRIIPTLSASSPIPQIRLSPNRSNFRVRLSDSADSGHESVPTPTYNAVLMLASSPQRHVLSVNALKDDIPAFRDALALLRVWANQRGYGEGRRTCIRGFEGVGPWWNAVLELLIRGEEPYGKTKTRRRPLGNGLSSYQLFKAALDFLGMRTRW